MKKTLFFLIIWLIPHSMLLQAQQPADALEMNELLVGMIQEITEAGGRWGTELSISFEEYDFAPLYSTRIELENLIDSKINLINSIEDVDGSEDLREAFREFLYLEKRLVLEGLIPFESIDESTTQEEIDAMLANMQTLIGQEESKMNYLRSLQEDYAEMNDFDLIDQ